MKKKMLLTLLAVVLLAGTFSVALGTDDPLITESYLKNVFLNEVKEYIADNQPAFNVVSVKKGQKFIGNSGCEFILSNMNAERVIIDCILGDGPYFLFGFIFLTPLPLLVHACFQFPSLWSLG